DPGSLREPEGHRPRASEDEYRGDEPVSGERGQSGERLHSDAPDDAGPLRVLPTARSVNRAARRVVRLVDQGSVATGSVFHHSDSRFTDNVLAAEDDAYDRRSHAASDDDADAGCVRIYLSDDGGGYGVVLVCQQHRGNRTAVLHELADWASCRSLYPAGGGAAAEKRWNGAHCRRGEAFLTMAAFSGQI